MNFGFPTEILEFLKWVATPGVAALALVIALEKWDWWQKWVNPTGKKLVTLALFIGLPFVGEGLTYVVSLVPQAYIAVVQGQLNIALAGLAAWVTSQVAHSYVKSLKG